MRRSRLSIVRRLARRLSDESGSASLEFITAGLILLLPLVYLVLTMSALQAGSFAVEGAARQGVRVFVQAHDLDEAKADAQRAVDFALADYGLSGADAAVVVTCTPHPRDCLTRLGQVTMSVSMRVALPLTPPVLTLDVPVGITLSATSTEQVSRFAGSR